MKLIITLFSVLTFITLNGQTPTIVSSSNVTNLVQLFNGDPTIPCAVGSMTESAWGPTAGSVVFDFNSFVSVANVQVIYGGGYGTGACTKVNFRVETGPTNIGPWTNVNLTCTATSCGTQGPKYVFTNPKVSRYWRISASDIVTPSNTVKILELIFATNNDLISSSTSSPLMNGNCTTLTAAAGGETYLWSPGGETTQSINVCNSGTYTCQVTNTSFTGNQDHTASIAVSTLGTQDNWVGPNGEVYSIHRNGNTVYYGGDFNAVGPITGSGAQIDETSGAANTSLPRVYGTINVIIPDGSGGWYIGGTFTRVGNYTSISNLAHINSDGTVDTGFKPVPNGAVNTLALYGSSLYVGGAFTSIQGLANNYVAKIDKMTGTPIFWNANCNNVVRSIQLYADQMIVGGDFTSLGGATRNYLGAVDTTYVQATTWAPNPNSAVYKVFVNGSKLYVGGDFTTISGVSKSRGAGYSLPAFTIDGYDFGANNRIHDFAFNNNVLYAAGTFTTIGGATRNYLAGLNYLNMVANSFNATADGIVRTVTVWNGNLIAGGDFSNIGGAARSRLASLNVGTGVANTWNPNVVGLKGTTYNVLALATNGSNLYAGGTFWSVGASARNNVAAVDATTGNLLSFDANANNIVRTVYSDGTYLYMGGDFTTVNGSVTKNRIAQVNATSGVATGWNPNADGSVNALAVSGTNLFVGGAFANIGGAARAKIASLTISTGGATAFNPSANGNVNALAVSGDTLFIGGAFTAIGGQTRNRVALYKISTSGILGTNPNANNTVSALAVNGNKLYIGGTFTSIGTTSINSLAEYNVSTNAITSFNSGIATSTGVNAITTADSSLYSAGGFQYANSGQAINNAATVKTLSNRLGYWMPQPDDIVRAIYLGSDKAYIGGRFKVIQSRYQPFFATTDLYNSGNPPTVNSVSPTSACANGTITITGTGFNNVTVVKIGSTSVPFTIVSSTSITITPSTAVSGVITVMNTLGNGVGTQTITVNALPPASITATGSTSFCQGSSVGLNANTDVGLTYQWKNNGTNISGATSSSYTATTAGSYTVAVTNSNSCSATSSATTVTINPITTPTFTQVSSICSGGTLNALPTTSNNSIAGSWSPALNNTSTTTYTFTPASTAAPTCATNATMTITVNSLPTASITAGSATTFCQGSSVVLNANSGAGLTYQWLNNGTNISGATSASYSAITSGSYTVAVTNSNSCSATSVATPVTVNPLTTPTFTQVAGICSGGALNALPTTSNNSIAGSWSPALNNTATTTYTFTPTSTASPTCATNATMTISVNSLTTPTFTQVAAICSGGTLNALPTTSNNSIAGSWSPALDNTTTTTYTFTPASTAAPTCAANATMTITVNSLPTASITAGSATTFCQGSSVVLNANSGAGLTYQWLNNGTNISGANSASYSATTSGSYTVTVTNSNSCSATSVATLVTVNPLTTPTFTQVEAICSGGALNALPTTSNNSIAGSWSPALNNTTTTTYIFTPTSTASPTCATNATMTISVNSLTTPTFTQVAAICSGGSLNALPTTSDNSIAGSWSPALDNTTTTTYTFTPASTAAPTCATNATMTITVNSLPTASITAGSATTFCQGSSVVLNANSGAGLTYQWLNNGTNISGANSASYSATTSGSYTVAVTSSNGCSATSMLTAVTVNLLPSVNAGNDQTVCAGTSVTLTASGADTYAWNNGVSNANAFVPLATNLYTVTGTNLTTGCSNTDQVMVTVNNLPSVNAGNDQTVCAGTSVTLTATGADTYAWNNSVSNANAFIPVATNLYTVTGTNLTTGCSNTDQVMVTVNNLPSVNAGIDQTVCAGTSVTLTAAGADTYAWNNGVSNANAFVPITTNQYTVTGTNLTTGCSNTDQVIVTVNNLPSVNAGIDQTVCAGTSVTLTATGADSYAWNNGVTNTNAFVPVATNLYTVTGTNLTTGCSNTDQVMVTVNNLPSVNAGIDQTVCAGTSVTLTAAGADTYAWNNGVSNANAFVPITTNQYTVTGTNLTTGCSNIDQVMVTVNNLPSVNAGIDQTVCAGTSVTLTAAGADTYAWNNGVSNANAFVPITTNQYTVTGTNLTTGCSNTDQVIVTVNNLPSVNAGIDQTVCAGTSVTLTATGADTYAWNNGVSNANAFVPITTNQYTVTGTNLTTGCSNIDQVMVTVNNLPNVTLSSFGSICDTAGVVTLSGGSPAGGVYSGSSVNNNSFNTSVGAGIYSVTYTYTDNNSCGNSATQNLTVIVCSGAGIENVVNTSGIYLYPNPTLDIVNIVSSEQFNSKTYALIDAMGRTISSGLLIGSTNSLSVSMLSTGTYYLKIDGSETLFKIMKE